MSSKIIEIDWQIWSQSCIMCSSTTKSTFNGSKFHIRQKKHDKDSVAVSTMNIFNHLPSMLNCVLLAERNVVVFSIPIDEHWVLCPTVVPCFFLSRGFGRSSWIIMPKGTRLSDQKSHNLKKFEHLALTPYSCILLDYTCRARWPEGLLCSTISLKSAILHKSCNLPNPNSSHASCSQHTRTPVW